MRFLRRVNAIDTKTLGDVEDHAKLIKQTFLDNIDKKRANPSLKIKHNHVNVSKLHATQHNTTEHSTCKQQ